MSPHRRAIVNAITNQCGHVGDYATEIEGESVCSACAVMIEPALAVVSELERQRDQAIRLSNLSKSLLDDANAECASLRDALENLTECVPIATSAYTNNWRPMDTAPKTGASIIYRYMEGSNVRAGLMCWMQTFSATESAEDTPCWWDLGLDDEAHKPTGWIPLPGGPA